MAKEVGLGPPPTMCPPHAGQGWERDSVDTRPPARDLLAPLSLEIASKMPPLGQRGQVWTI